MIKYTSEKEAGVGNTVIEYTSEKEVGDRELGHTGHTRRRKLETES
jgi:hypothetical protein